MRSAATPDAATVLRRRPAMGTLFEFRLVGEDAEHLSSVAEAALDEVDRVERLLSRHDPASEVSRVNREAAGRPVRVGFELFGIVEDCRARSDRLGGYFDPCATGRADSPSVGKSLRLDPEMNTIQFLDPRARLDFGGYGKGYALDAAAQVLDEFGVDSALLHGGTSSILARGRQADGSPWRVGLRDPSDADSEVIRIDLADCGVSSSAAFDAGSGRSDLVDPIRGRPLDRQAGCSVIAQTALEAEVLSTAFLAMGRRPVASFLGRAPSVRVAWIEDGEVEWLGAGGLP